MKLSIIKIECEMARQGLTQGALAERAGMSHTWTAKYLRIVRKARDIQPFTAGKIAKGLGVDVAELLPDPEPVSVKRATPMMDELQTSRAGAIEPPRNTAAA